MHYPPLSAAEEELHTPLALRLRAIAREAPDGEAAHRAAADYLLARLAGIFEAQPRLTSLGYDEPENADAPQVVLVELTPAGPDVVDPRFDQLEREDVADEWFDLLATVERTTLQRVFAWQPAGEMQVSRQQVIDRFAAITARMGAPRVTA